MAFTWIQPLTTGIVSNYNVMDEIKDNADWVLDHVRCSTYYVSVCSTNFSVYHTSYLTSVLTAQFGLVCANFNYID